MDNFTADANSRRWNGSDAPFYDYSKFLTFRGNPGPFRFAACVAYVLQFLSERVHVWVN